MSSEITVNLPAHEVLKRKIADKFTNTSSYLGSHIRKEIMETDFKHLRSIHKPFQIKKGDVITVFEGTKSRPAVVIKVLKDRTVLYLAVTSTENIHCMTPYKSRFLGEGCFAKAFSICTEEFALENFTGVFDNMKALNLAMKDFKELINTNFK